LLRDWLNTTMYLMFIFRECCPIFKLGIKRRKRFIEHDKLRSRDFVICRSRKNKRRNRELKKKKDFKLRRRRDLD